MASDPEPTRQGPVIVIAVVIFVVLAVWLFLQMYGAAHSF
jgi:hypothetical protein